MNVSIIAVFNEMLEAYSAADLLERNEVRRAVDLFEPDTSTDARPHTIFYEKIAYIGDDVDLAVFRPKGRKGESRPRPELALIKDTVGIYQPLSSAQLVRFLKDPPRGLRAGMTLGTIVDQALQAQSRIESMPSAVQGRK